VKCFTYTNILFINKLSDKICDKHSTVSVHATLKSVCDKLF